MSGSSSCGARRRAWIAAVGAAIVAAPGAASAQGVDFMEWFNDANRAAVEQGRTTNLNSAAGANATRRPWPDISEAELARHVFTMAQLKAMVSSDRPRAQRLLEGRVITVRGIADRPNRWGTWIYLKDPAVRFSAKGEWARAISQPREGAELSLRGRVARVQASMIHLEEPEILP